MNYFCASNSPWARRVYRPTIEDLHSQVAHFFAYMSAIQEEKGMREAAFCRVNYLLMFVVPGAKVSVYGSVASSIYLPNADLDISVELPPDRRPPDLARIADVFRSSGLYQSVKMIDRTTVPVLKLIEYSTNMPIDVSFNTHSFTDVYQWIDKMRHDCKYLDQLALILKQFLYVNGMNSPFTGGLPSYALLVMVAHFLKRVNYDAFPPKLQEAPLGMLLLMFLNFYGRIFDYKHCVLAFDKDEPVLLDKDELIARDNAFASHSFLTIVDPVDPENDLGRGAYDMPRIRTAFLVASEALRAYIRYDYNEQSDKSLDDFCTPSVLSFIVPITPTDIIQRSASIRSHLVTNAPPLSRV